MKFTIDIAEQEINQFIETGVMDAIKKAFDCPRYSNESGGIGWQELERQVKKIVLEIDFSEDIKRLAKARLDNVLDEIVTKALAEKAKQTAKQMIKNGTLLDE